MIRYYFESVSSTIFVEYMLPRCLLAHFKINLPSLDISFEIIAIRDLLISGRSDDDHSILAFWICKGENTSSCTFPQHIKFQIENVTCYSSALASATHLVQRRTEAR